VKSNYPMTLRKNNAMSVTEKMMYPAKLIDAWLLMQRRYDTKMPYIGEFIGE